jgi:hypothetical protein
VLLASAWIAVFLPAIVRARQTTALSAAERWRRRMELIAPRHAQTRGAGRWILVPESKDDLARASFRKGQRRRRRILGAMILACVGSLSAAFVLNGTAWEVHLACDGSLVLYLALLMEAKRRRRERMHKVRSLAKRRARRARRADPVSWLAPARAAGDRR